MALDNGDSNGFTLSPNYANDDVEYYQNVTKKLWIICPPITLFFGTAGNILSGLVMSRKALQATTTSLLFILLAVTDTVVLWVGLLRQYLVFAFEVQDIRLLSVVTCKLHTFVVYWISHLASWMLVCIACERCFVVFFPFRASLASKRNAVLFVLLIALLLLVVNMQLLWTIERIEYDDPNGGTVPACHESKGYNFFALHVWPWIDFSLISIAPFTILFFANFGIVARLYLRRMARVGSLTCVNFAVSIWFLVTTLPISVVLINQHVWIQNQEFFTPEYKAKRGMVWAIVANVSYLNNSCNFILYIMGSRRFRSELLAFFKKNNRSTTSTAHV